jgi:hypothetical protein
MLSAKLVAEGNHYKSLLRTPIHELKTSYKPSDMSLTSLMYYGGYATIDSFDKASKSVILKIPNASVEKHLAQNYLASVFSKTGLNRFNTIITTMHDLLVVTPIPEMESKIKEIEETFDTLLSYYSYDAVRDEANFQIIMDTIFLTRFDRLLPQHRTLDGRADTVLFSNSRVFVLEYKYGKSSKEALKQINRKEYYKNAEIFESKLSILLLGINLKINEESNKRIEISYELYRDSSR